MEVIEKNCSWAKSEEEGHGVSKTEMSDGVGWRKSKLTEVKR